MVEPQRVRVRGRHRCGHLPAGSPRRVRDDLSQLGRDDRGGASLLRSSGRRRVVQGPRASRSSAWARAVGGSGNRWPHGPRRDALMAEPTLKCSTRPDHSKQFICVFSSASDKGCGTAGCQANQVPRNAAGRAGNGSTSGLSEQAGDGARTHDPQLGKPGDFGTTKPLTSGARQPARQAQPRPSRARQWPLSASTSVNGRR